MNSKKELATGFTLVEISIVMIIVGLLIGGTFAGMKLIDNMQVNRSIQDLKSIETAALTFRDTYGRLPGDIVNPSARLPNCTVAPCATSGNGDRRISPPHPTVAWTAAMDPTFERFTFWAHLQAADMLTLDSKNTTDMEFGEGQPSAPIGGGYRLTSHRGPGWACGDVYNDAIVLLIGHPSNALTDTASNESLNCRLLQPIDQKMDDGYQLRGKIVSAGCNLANTCANSYDSLNRTGYIFYDVRF